MYKRASQRVIIVTGNNERVHQVYQLGDHSDEVVDTMFRIAMERQRIVAESILKAKEAFLMSDAEC